MIMKLDNQLFDKIQKQAEASPRRSINYDLITSAEDSSQRMLNVLMCDTVIPIHRHTETSETVVVCRGAIREEFYDDQGHKTEEFILRAGGKCPAIQVPKGVFHTSVCLEDGSVIFEAKDGVYKPISPEDVL
ncbi:WbuC family cupin fold metalloprotein [Alistipes sp.]|uniref:WbuC family cupin fold metalloprotein n=1 Tax=Alistipes sp. TaxID=1872444 RepID=UPI003A836537